MTLLKQLVMSAVASYSLTWLIEEGREKARAQGWADGFVDGRKRAAADWLAADAELADESTPT